MATSETSSNELTRAESLWQAADALRGQIDPAEYKQVVLGLLFLKYISDAFHARRLGTMQTRTLRVLTPGRHVGAEEQQDDGEPFAEKHPRLPAELKQCFREGERLMAVVRERLKWVGDAG